MPAAATVRRSAVWRVRGGDLPLGPIPLLMGIVNVTPDSFSDGGRHALPERAIAHGLALAGAGAAILDVGGESTRPGAAPVPAGEELARVMPVVQGLAERASVPISIDTTKPDVAREALAAGAAIVNDVSALFSGAAIAELAAEAGAGLVLMHRKGEPPTMQDDPRYGDLFGEIAELLFAAAEAAERAGVDPAGIALDPGIGFGKTAADSYRLLAGIERFAATGRPVLVGHSRKSFLDPDRRHAPAERVPESIAAGVLAAIGGAAILRVHDVAAHARALGVYARYLAARSGETGEEPVA